MKWFERFCARHEHLGIRNLMLYIIMGNVAIFLLSTTQGGADFINNWLYFQPSLILRGQVWRLFTFVFLEQSGSIFNLLFSSLFYYFIGNLLENEWGRMKLTIYYFSGVLLHIVFALVLSIWYGDTVMYLLTGAHYLNMSLFLAYAVLDPNAYLRMFFIIPVKVKWLAWIDAAYITIGLFLNPFPLNMLPLVVLSNFAFYFAPSFFKYTKRRTFETKNRNDFERKKREVKKRGYLHRCVVCGKTDATHPDVEFRYCSLCNGYACYCEEHIMEHTHIK